MQFITTKAKAVENVFGSWCIVNFDLQAYHKTSNVVLIIYVNRMFYNVIRIIFD